MAECRNPHMVSVRGKNRPVWPEGLTIQRWIEPTVGFVTFPDIDAFHPQLIEAVIAREDDAKLAKSYPGNIGSRKIFHLDRWDVDAASLIDSRALALFRAFLGGEEAVVDLSWASLYRTGDYCMPHSHFRAMASIVYFLETGDEGAGGKPGGSFNFADPRMKVCCRHEANCMTSPCAPHVEAGTMIIFPGYLVHFVDVYRGTRPRITLSWNINRKAVPGVPRHAFSR